MASCSHVRFDYALNLNLIQKCNVLVIFNSDVNFFACLITENNGVFLALSSPSEASEIMKSIGEAIQYLHSINIAHRDVKVCIILDLCNINDNFQSFFLNTFIPTNKKRPYLMQYAWTMWFKKKLKLADYKGSLYDECSEFRQVTTMVRAFLNQWHSVYTAFSFEGYICLNFMSL